MCVRVCVCEEQQENCNQAIKSQQLQLRLQIQVVLPARRRRRQQPTKPTKQHTKLLILAAAPAKKN